MRARPCNATGECEKRNGGDWGLPRMDDTSRVDHSPAEKEAAGPLAAIQVRTPISIVVPTFREVENAPLLLDRLDAFRRGAVRAVVLGGIAGSHAALDGLLS